MALHSLKLIQYRCEPGLLSCISRVPKCIQWDTGGRNRIEHNCPRTKLEQRYDFQFHQSLLLPRYYSSHPDGTNQPSQPSRFWKNILDRFNRYITQYTDKLQKKSPRFRKVVDVVRVIKCVKFVAQDTKTYIMVSKDIWIGKELETFSRRELVLYHEMPKDILKLIPLLLLAAIPFVGNAFFIVGYWYPRVFLTQQFWTDEQKREFFQLEHKKKCSEYKHILTYMDKQVHKHMSGEGREKMLEILQKVEKGSQPSVEELLDVKEYFESYPFSIESLPSPYFRHLVKSCDMSTRRFPLLMYGMLFYIKQRRTPLQEDGNLLLHTDQVILREGLDSLTDEEICKACLRRGLNPYGLTKEEQLNFLDKWTNISSKLDENSISLLLHAPVLFSYNSPTNIQLMKGKKYGWKRKS